MKSQNLSRIVYLSIFLGLFLPMFVEAADNSLPTAWNANSHTSLLNQFNQIKLFIFSTPLKIMAVGACLVAIYQAFANQHFMPLFTVAGIIILSNLISTFLDMIYPEAASGMTLNILSNFLSAN